MATMPKLPPPRLIALSRRARRSPKWLLSVLEARLVARGFSLPSDDELPESLAIEEFLAGELTHMTLGQLHTFLEECAFLRRYTDLEEHVAAAVVDADDVPLDFWMGGFDPNDLDVDLADVPFREIIECFEFARAHALIELIENVGLRTARQLPGLPPSLAADLKGADKARKMRMRNRRDRERGDLLDAALWAGAMLEMLHGDEDGELPEEIEEALAELGALTMFAGPSTASSQPSTRLPPQDRYLCGHEACRDSQSAGAVYTVQGFVDHWHHVHLEREGEAPAVRRGSKWVRCGHADCAGKLRAFEFDGLRGHTGAVHCPVPGAQPPVTVALLDVNAAYDA